MASKKKRTQSGPPPAPVRRKPPRPAPGSTPRERQRAAQQAAERRSALRRKLVAGGLATAAVASVVVYVVLDQQKDSALLDTLTAGSCDVDTQADPTRPPGQNHIASPSYQVVPPAGGDHLASAARAGVYSGQSVPADGSLVHALEHGYVIVWHQPDLPLEQKAKLTSFQAEHAEDVIVAERADLPVPLAVTAWGQRLLCQQPETGPLQPFFDKHVGNGPEDEPRG